MIPLDIGTRISELRTQKGYSVYKLAKLSEVSATYIHELEDGKKQPTVEVLSRICSALDITLAEFFSPETNSDSIPPELQRLLDTAKSLTPEQLRQLNEFLKTLKK